MWFLLALHLTPDVGGEGLGGGLTQECFVQINLVFYFLIQFDLAYCVDRDTYCHVTENLSDTSYGTITSTL